MAFNGDGPHNKRLRTDAETSNHRGHEGSTGGGGGSTTGAGFRVGGGGYASGGNSVTEEPRRKRQDDNKPNHVLLFTIINPMYPITVEVLHTICQSSGQVLRIVIFKKNGVQAMYRLRDESQRDIEWRRHILWMLYSEDRLCKDAREHRTNLSDCPGVRKGSESGTRNYRNNNEA
ncbi:smooth [Carabus blaptoides fortunei]